MKQYEKVHINEYNLMSRSSTLSRPAMLNPYKVKEIVIDYEPQKAKK